mgnify:CR=1 FL=1
MALLTVSSIILVATGFYLVSHTASELTFGEAWKENTPGMMLAIIGFIIAIMGIFYSVANM